MISRTTTITGLSIICLLALALMPAAAAAQGYGFEEQPAQTEVTDQEVGAFAEAQNEVGQIQQDYQGRIADTADPEAQQAIVEEANEKMVDAVQESGLSVERYNTILNSAHADPELQARISRAARDM